MERVKLKKGGNYMKYILYTIGVLVGTVGAFGTYLKMISMYANNSFGAWFIAHLAVWGLFLLGAVICFLTYVKYDYKIK